ncbi:MAG: heat-inducible transcription repressor HrcA [Clostridiales bacterium 43-6]|nr:MAG: heat-inducible transcription repressor HrcA [Clostridiales bacterium 43-6]
MTLNERKLNILAAIVKNYIETGEPVGSKMLCDMENMNLSSATIRNEMSELSELKLLEQPHTSAGRIPTLEGYRLYVDKLMNRYALSEEDKRHIDSMLPDFVDDPFRFMDEAGNALSELTRCAVISTTVADKNGVIKKIDFFTLNRRTVMIVLVTSSGIVKSRNSRSDFDITDTVIDHFSELLQATVYNMPLSEFTSALVQSLAAAAGDTVLIISPMLYTIYELVKDACETELLLKGELNLLQHREFSGDRAKELFTLLNKRRSILSLLDTNDKELAVFLGLETEKSGLVPSSLVVARYNTGKKETGSIGVIGPYRMDYEHIIPSIEYFAESIGRLLSETLSE